MIKLMIVIESYRSEHKYHAVEAMDDSLDAIRKSILELFRGTYSWEDMERCGCWLTSTSPTKLLHVQEMEVPNPREFDISSLFANPYLDEQTLKDAGYSLYECDENCTDREYDYDDD